MRAAAAAAGVVAPECIPVAAAVLHSACAMNNVTFTAKTDNQKCECLRALVSV